jgi:oligopeptide transport system ATP-binding protein
VGNDILLEIRGLKVYYPVKKTLIHRVVDYVRAVDGVSFSVERGSTVGLVGESGSGKTTIGRAIVRLVNISEGSIFYDGVDISSLSRRAFFSYRKRIQMIFQDPSNSLNPKMSIYAIISEPLGIHFSDWSQGKKRTRVAELLENVGLKSEHIDRYPHEFSGGERQRIGIARTLAVEPEFIVCDEPVSALDVSVQAQIINLLQDLKEEHGFTYLFIGHDLAVVKHISDTVLVMNNGKIVEQACADELYKKPQHEYTKKLLSAVPKVQISEK